MPDLFGSVGELVPGDDGAPEWVTFVVYGSPRPAGSKRSFAVRKGAKRVGGRMVGGTYTGRTATADANPKSGEWKLKVEQVAGQVMAGRPIMEGPVFASFAFYVLRPKGHFGKRGLLPSKPSFPIVKPDVLKLARAVEDALTKIVYRDDSQIIGYDLLRKWYGSPERVEITIRVATMAELAAARARA